jgi:hypothetical protein
MTQRLNIPPSGQYRIIKRNATVQDVAGYMVEIIRAMKDDPFVQMEAEILSHTPAGTDILQALSNRAYDQMFFEPDTRTVQTIRTPRRSLMDKRANCVDYTVYIGSIAHALGFPVTVRIVQLQGQSNYGHVYPIVNGNVIDVVPGQIQDGTEYLHRVHKYPLVGYTWPHIAKQDFYI